jgi:hypothetical protein
VQCIVVEIDRNTLKEDSIAMNCVVTFIYANRSLCSRVSHDSTEAHNLVKIASTPRRKIQEIRYRAHRTN